MHILRIVIAVRRPLGEHSKEVSFENKHSQAEGCFILLA